MHACVMFELMLRHTRCITNGARPIGKQESRFEQKSCVWEKIKSLCSQASSSQWKCLHPAHMHIHVHVTIHIKAVAKYIYFFFAASKLFGGHH